MDRIYEAMGHLGAAISQSLPSDDQVIMEHVRQAHALISAEWRDRQAAKQHITALETALRRSDAAVLDLIGYLGRIRKTLDSTPNQPDATAYGAVIVAARIILDAADAHPGIVHTLASARAALEGK